MDAFLQGRASKTKAGDKTNKTAHQKTISEKRNVPWVEK